MNHNVLANTGHFFVGLLVGFFVSGINAAICVPPVRGAVMRIIGVFGLLVLVLATGIYWAAAVGALRADFPVATKYGVAVSSTIVTCAVISGLWDGSWYGENDPAKPTYRPRWRLVKVLDYVLGTFLCYYFLTLGVTFTSELRVYLPHWLGGLHNALMAETAARAMLIAAGLLYAQLLSGAAIRALNTALRHDWRISRGWNYLLLAPPFLLFTPKVVTSPGLLAGVMTHLAMLFLGWRYTDQPPQTTLKTLRLLRQRPALKRKAASHAGQQQGGTAA